MFRHGLNQQIAKLPVQKKSSYCWLASGLLALLAACVPATVPEHLAYTPGPPMLTMDGVYNAGAFTVRFPPGWIVVSSPANQPAAVTLVAPDESATIRLSTHPDLEPMPDEDLPNGMRLHTEQATLDDGLVVTFTLGAPVAEWESYLAVFEAVVASTQSQ
jgi:hypothetical protein